MTDLQRTESEASEPQWPGIAFGMLFVVAGVAALTTVGYEMYKVIESDSWPSRAARITAIERGQSDIVTRVEGFFVESGASFTTQRVSYGGTVHHRDELLRKFPLGAERPVYASPTDGTDMVLLRPGVSVLYVFMSSFISLLLIGGGVICIRHAATSGTHQARKSESFQKRESSDDEEDNDEEDSDSESDPRTVYIIQDWRLGVVFGIFIGSLGVLPLSMAGYQCYKAAQVMSWKPQLAEIKAIGDGDESAMEGVYVDNHEPFVTHRVSYGWNQHSRHLVKKEFPVGSDRFVFVSRTDPTDIVLLRPGISRLRVLAAAALGVVFLFGGAMQAWGAWKLGTEE